MHGDKLVLVRGRVVCVPVVDKEAVFGNEALDHLCVSRHQRSNNNIDSCMLAYAGDPRAGVCVGGKQVSCGFPLLRYRRFPVWLYY